jgi:hypothetical protein
MLLCPHLEKQIRSLPTWEGCYEDWVIYTGKQNMPLVSWERPELLDGNVPWDPFVRVGWLLMDHPREDQESESHIFQSCVKPQICTNSVSLEPHFGAHGRQH